ncbi:MAG: DUF1894 domain-containing protein [Methanoregulaceae archaeon]
MGCIDQLPYEVILSGTSFKEAREYVEKNIPEVYHVDPGFKVFDEYIIGVPPVAIGLDGNIVYFPYTKPCHGTFLLKVENPDEAARLRRLKLHRKK